jgi:ankyrin repeat protein
MVKSLLSYSKINHRVRDGRGRSVLLIALAIQNVSMLKLLLDYDEKHCNSASGAAYREQLRNNKVLLNNNKPNGICFQNPNPSSGWLLREMDGNNRTLLYLACCSNNISLVRALLYYIPHLQINQPNADAERHTPLFAAVTRCDVRLCQILLSEYGADPNIRDGFGKYKTNQILKQIFI